MMTAPTGQAVFDPFAPPPSTSTQPVVTSSVVVDPDVSTSQSSSQPIAQNSTQQLAQSNPPSEDDQTNQSADQADLVDVTQLPNNVNQPLAELPDLPTADVTSEGPDAEMYLDDTETDNQPLDQVADQPNDDLQPDFDLTEDERISLFDEVLTETEQSASVFDQIMPATILANDPLNPQVGNNSGSRKPETVVSNSAPQEAGLIGRVEYEPSSELPVEVEGFLERVEDHSDKLPQEIVVADGNAQALPQSHPTQTVIVLPITEEEGQAQAKDVKLSFTWLLEWSHKIIKKFVGKVVYRHESNS